MNLINIYDKYRTRIPVIFSILFIISLIFRNFLIYLALLLIASWSTYYYFRKNKKPETIIWAAINIVYFLFIIRIMNFVRLF